MSPMYDYSCTVCKREFEAHNTIDERENEKCCGIRANKLIAKPNTKLADPVVYNFFCEGSGEHITGRKQRDEMLKRKGLIAVG